MLTVRGLKKTFASDSDVKAVRGIDFDVRQGEFYTLLGPSGCGKTTTLRCIAGLEKPDEGEIIIAGKVVFSSARGILLSADQRDLGMVFQSYAIWPHMTVFENVAFPFTHGRRRYSKKETAERVHGALSLVQMDEYAHRPAPLLSGGQQQRVALARALAYEPKLLLLDEPLSNLDAKLRDEMRLELRQLVSRVGITTIYVTHDQLEALGMSDRLAVLRNGVISQEGTPAEIYRSPKDDFVATFVGKSNVISGRVFESRGGSGVVDTPLGRFNYVAQRPTAAGDEVSLSIRPEAFDVSLDTSGREENSLHGVVELLTFAGDTVDCLVRVADRSLKVKTDPYLDLVVGGSVRLRLPPERCVLLPRSGAAVEPALN
jgi:iron(III) transport system ATP-binding protein